MAEVIYKYPLQMHEEQELAIPAPAYLLSIGQDPSGVVCAWYIVDPDRPAHQRRIVVLGTGQEFPSDVAPADHVTTIRDRIFIWHIFERAA